MPPSHFDTTWRSLLQASQDTTLEKRKSTGRPTDPEGLVLEAWAQGFMVGSLIIMSCITVANMRKGVLLHKLILVELILGIWHGFWILFQDPIYAWWLSVSAIFLNASWSLHNVISWMKIKPFLPRWASLVFIWAVILVQPYWVVEIFANFQYFHGWGDIFLKTRPWEPLCRDPWWILTTITLFYKIATRYELTTWEIFRISPRFVIMLAAMIISVMFIIPDVLSVTGVLNNRLPTGINPFFKISFVFKCLTDSVVLDDFKTALDRLRAFKLGRMGSISMDRSTGEQRFQQQGSPSYSAPLSSSSERRTSSALNKSTSGYHESLPVPSTMHRYSRDRDAEVKPPNTDYQSSISGRKDSQQKRMTLPNRGSADAEYAQAMREVARDDQNQDRPP